MLQTRGRMVLSGSLYFKTGAGAPTLVGDVTTVTGSFVGTY